MMLSLEVIVTVAITAWLIIGLVVLIAVARKYPHGVDWNTPFQFDGIFLPLGIVVFVLWLFAWPMHAWMAPYVEAVWDGEPSTAAKHQLGLRKRLAVGEQVLTLTPLAPVGYVEHAGQRLEAQCQHGHIAAGQTVTVVGYYMQRAMVKT